MTGKIDAAYGAMAEAMEEMDVHEGKGSLDAIAAFAAAAVDHLPALETTPTDA